MSEKYHVPVLLEETIRYLDPRPGRTLVDATLGGGGHALAILKKLEGRGRLICIDRDPEAIAAAKVSLKGFDGPAVFINDNFANIKRVLKELNVDEVDGVLLDLGVSSRQIDSQKRGFSLKADGPLDMRMDQRDGLSARDIVNSFGLDDLAKLIREYGEEYCAKRIAATIVRKRRLSPIKTTGELLQAVREALSGIPPKAIFDAATRTFQAIRIFVNNELGSLSRALTDSLDVLSDGGKLVVISYHSLEDRIVKNLFKREAAQCLCPPASPVCTCKHEKRIEVLTKKPVVADENEVERNPRSRSAKLRAAKRIL